MSKIRLTRQFDFEMAHALDGYDGLCRNVHGHSYKFFVTILGEPVGDMSNPKYGMVMDFGVLKGIVNELIVDRFDHTLVLRDNAENRAVMEQMAHKWPRVVLTDYQPTCEMMLVDFAAQIRAALPEGVVLVELELYETARSKATWRLSDQQADAVAVTAVGGQEA